jgi:hypothetical protein
MAIPTATGSWSYPYENSPKRSFYQGVASAATLGTLPIISTISAAGIFTLTKLMFAVYDASATAGVQIKLKNDVIFRFSGATISTHTIDLGPGIKSAASDTQTVELLTTGVTCGVSCYAYGYMES